MKKLARQLIACVVCFGVITPVFATNGYFAHGYGTKNKGLVGAGVALPQDAMIAATNPAGMVWVGDRIDLGAAIFSPSPRSYEPTAPGGAPTFALPPQKVESDSDYFIIPHFAKNWVYDANSTMGVTVYGNGGMNTDYPGNAPCGLPGGSGTYCAGAAGVNLEQLFINGTYSRKLNATNSFGVSLIFAYQRFEAKGLGTFGPAGFDVSNDPGNLTNNGVDSSNGFGVKLGWQGEVTPQFSFGVSYQTEMQMSDFDKYAGLFAEQGGFNIPATWTIGMAYTLANKSKIVLDVQQIMYSDIASVGNPMMPALINCFGSPSAPPSDQCLGGDNGPGFGWDDMTIVKIGYQWTMGNMPGWTWRAGYSQGDQPIPDSEVLFNILAPGVMEQHVTFGFTRDLPNNREFNFAFMYALENDVTGPNPLGDGQEIKLQMRQWEIEGSYSW